MSASPQTAAAGAPLYVFGYGSLIFKQNFPFVRKIPCMIKGYQRVFYQGSTDHRGVPGSPGRVVTIIPVPSDTNDAATAPHVCGVAFEIAPNDIEEAIRILDLREQGGYDRVDVPVYAIPAPHTELLPSCVVYIANADNSEWLGHASDAAIAAQIMGSAGPSGPNREYLFKLADALRDMEADDPHVFGIADEARRIAATEAVQA